jgi:hypothetical protein
VRFLIETDRANIGPGDLTDELRNAFIGWLNHKPTRQGKPTSEISRAVFYGCFEGLLEILRRDTRWSCLIPKTLEEMHSSPWPGRHKKSVGTKNIDSDQLDALMSACTEEVIATMRRVEGGWALLGQEPSPIAPVKPIYADLGACLTTIEAVVRGQFISDKIVESIPGLSCAITRFHGGLHQFSEYFYPHPRVLVPLAILLSLFTGENTGSLLDSCEGNYWTGTILGKARFYWNIWKERSKCDQDKSVAQDPDDPVHPERLVAFLRRWTRYLRPLAHPADSQCLFLFVSLTRRNKVAKFESKSGGPTGDYIWQDNLNRFLKAHNLKHVHSRQFRVAALDIVHVVTGGDLRQMQAQANHKHLGTAENHYVTDGAKQRDEERLVQIFEGRQRWLKTNGKIDTRGRPEDADIGSATPAWSCLDPYSGYLDPQNSLCSAYAQCPVCPLGSVDFQSVYACAQLHNLLAALRAAVDTMAPAAWLERCAPVIGALSTKYLPRFSEAIHKEAARLYLPPLPLPE